jgi:poly(3-hydroxybutyrate) depolymerase
MQGSVVDMVEDVGNGIAWVLDNIEQYGGDPQQLYVMGQSCGGHLAMLAMLEQCRIWAAMGQNSTTPESSIESGCESEEQPDAVFKALPFLPTDKWSSGDIKVRSCRSVLRPTSGCAFLSSAAVATKAFLAVSW